MKRSIDDIVGSFGIDQLSKTPNGYKGCCAINPDHIDRKPSMHIHIQKGYVKCFSCGAFRTLFDFLIDKGVSFDEAIDFFFTDFEKKENNPEGITEYALGRKIPKSMLDRGFTVGTLKHFGVGYDEFEKRITIPLKYNNVLYGVNYRINTPKGKKIWSSEGFVKDNFIYNYQPTEERVYCEGFCFDGKTEVFTEKGWIFFEDYTKERVYQVTKDFRLELVTPYKITKERYTGDMVEYSNSIFSSKTTGNHNMVGIKRGDITPQKRLAREGFPSNYSIPTKVILDGSGLNITDEEILLQVAIKADATIRVRKTDKFNYAYFNLKKERKKKRLIFLLCKLGIDYKITKCSRDGWNDISFRIPKHYCKEFDSSWLFNTTLYQKKLILNEVSFWDGYRPETGARTEYYTTIYGDAVFIQTMAHLSNMKANIYSRDNTTVRSKIIHRVNILWQSKDISYANLKKEIYNVYDEMVYCTSVPSGMLLVRKNGFIYVCGNTDTWKIWQNKTLNVSACLTAIPSEGQLSLMAQHKKIFLALDNDKAGWKGAFKIHKELGREIEIKIIPYIGKDPGDLNKSDWEKAINSAVEFMEFEVQMINRNIDLYNEIKKSI